MATTLNFKDIIDLPMWRPEAPLIAATSAGASMTFDKRNSQDRHPYLYYLRSATAFDFYDPTTGDWMPLSSPALTGTFGAGASCVFHPSQGPRGKILAGSTNISLNLDNITNGAAAAATWTRTTTTATVTTATNHNLASGQVLVVTVSSDIAAIVLGNVTITVTGATTYTFTCLNAGGASGTLTIGYAVGGNQLANRGDGRGFKIRVIGASAGKIEERLIVANTGGSTPTLILDSALSFVPTTADSFEIISGRVYLLSSGVMAVGSWKYYDIATNTFSGNFSITNLPATISIDTSMIAMSELHVPWNRNPGEGFISGSGTYNGALLNCIAASAASSTTITGSGMFADLQSNEYRNFQVRIVEDSVNPTAVGQRRRISSHTSGATGVFTVSAFAVTPSSSAKFVVENDDDKIIANTSAAVLLHTFNISTAAWDSTTWSAPVANGAGVILEQGFGYERDDGLNSRHSFLFRVRGGASSAIDVLDIAAAATGTWSNAIVYGNAGQTFTTGTCGTYDPATLSGRFLHINVNSTQRMVRVDLKNRILDPSSYLRFPQSTAIAGAKMACGLFIDGTTKLNFVYLATSTQTQLLSLAVQR